MNSCKQGWTDGEKEQQRLSRNKDGIKIKMYSFGFFAFIFKLPPLVKLSMTGLAVFIGTVAASGGFDLHDIWFDYVLFVIISSIISGMPEPDTQLTGWRFLYTWMYRSGHLMVASATAYFIHTKKWQDIGGAEETLTHMQTTQRTVSNTVSTATSDSK